MYRVVVLDDNAEQARALASMVESTPCGTSLEASCCTSPSELASLAAARDISIVLLDVVLAEGERSGVQLARRLFPEGSGVQIIYVTGSAADHCLEVYETDHVYLLEKPVDPDRLAEALHRAVARLDKEASVPFAVSVHGKMRLVRPEKVRFVESDRRKVRINLQDEVVETYSSLARMQERLPGCFLRCHKSFLVNAAYIDTVGHSRITLIGGGEVPVSQRYRQRVRAELEARVRSLL